MKTKSFLSLAFALALLAQSALAQRPPTRPPAPAGGGIQGGGGYVDYEAQLLVTSARDAAMERLQTSALRMLVKRPERRAQAVQALKNMQLLHTQDRPDASERSRYFFYDPAAPAILVLKPFFDDYRRVQPRTPEYSQA